MASRGRCRRVTTLPVSLAIQRRSNTLQQSLIVEGFCQEIHCAGSHRLQAHFLVALFRYKIVGILQWPAFNCACTDRTFPACGYPRSGKQSPAGGRTSGTLPLTRTLLTAVPEISSCLAVHSASTHHHRQSQPFSYSSQQPCSQGILSWKSAQSHVRKRAIILWYEIP